MSVTAFQRRRRELAEKQDIKKKTETKKTANKKPKEVTK